MSTPWTSATVIGMAPLSAVSVAMPRPRTTVSARFTAMLCARSYTPGVSEQVLTLGERGVDLRERVSRGGR